MYRLLLKRKAEKDLDRLQGDVWERIRGALLALRENPRPPGCRKVRGSADTYRIRIGDYRAVYEVDDENLIVTVLRVKHRWEAYRGL